MSTATFQPKKGDRVYSEDAQSGKYIAHIDLGHVVQVLMETNSPDHECWDGGIEVWPRVFEQPPVIHLEAEVAELVAKINARSEQLRVLNLNITEAERKSREVLARLAKHAHLARLDDYIAGRITHFVTLGRYGHGIEVKTFAEVMGKERSHRVPLLVLYGDPCAESHREMRDTHWCRVGDGDDLKVMPCTSAEEAVAKAQVEVDKVFDAWRKDPKGNYGHSSLGVIFTAALKSGLMVPDDVRAEVNRRENVATSEALAKRRADLVKVQAEVAELEAKAAKSDL